MILSIVDFKMPKACETLIKMWHQFSFLLYRKETKFPIPERDS